MNANEIKELVLMQREHFCAGATLPVNTRLKALLKLKACILKYEDEIHAALKKDLGKSSFESYMCETGMTLSELSYMIKHIFSFTKEKSVRTPLAQFHAKSYKKPSPYGVVLIMSPWNYPFMLTMEPLVDAIAAGNTAIVKPSAYSPYTSEIIRKIIEKCFEKEYVSVVTGGRAENTCLLNEHFDYIFFTGSQTVGKEVMRKASAHLTPITLELGGKSPCIVDKSANIKLAAKRIVFGKFLNCGQTCVAPDYIDHSKVDCGGGSDRSTLMIEPTVMDRVTFSDPVMQEEIFGPVMPVLIYDSLDEVITNVNALPHPLALYIFTSNRETAKRITSRCGFGGGCINDTIIHLATSEMGFGGFGESGMGAYHGKTGFDTFSHYKSIVDKKTWLDLPMRYQPYRKIYNKLIHIFLK